MKFKPLKYLKKAGRLLLASLLLFVFIGIAVTEAFHSHHLENNSKRSTEKSFYAKNKKASCALCSFISQKQTHVLSSASDFLLKAKETIINSVKLYQVLRTYGNNSHFPLGHSPPKI